MNATHELSAETLQDLTPVHRLSREQRARLAQSGIIASLPTGKKLTAVHDAPWLDYVLTGKLCLLRDASKEIIESGSLRACQPVFESGRLRDSAVALTEVQLLRLDRQLYESLTGDRQPVGDSFDEMDLSIVESAMLIRFYQACKQGSLELPSLPKVARAIQDAMNNPAVTSMQLARIVQIDPAVTGGLIRLANSPVYRGARPTTDVRDAIIRLGFNMTRSVVLGMAMQKVFKTKSPLMKQRIKDLWNRSVHISALSFVIARHGGGCQPEHALLAGLLHDVGVIPILDHVSRYYREIDDAELDAAILKLRVMIGEMVVRYWGLESDLVDVVRESDQWYRDRGDQPDVCDIVLVARLYRLNQSDAEGPLPHYDNVPAYLKLGLGLSEAQGAVDVIAEAGEQLAAVTEMLKGTKE